MAVDGTAVRSRQNARPAGRRPVAPGPHRPPPETAPRRATETPGWQLSVAVFLVLVLATASLHVLFQTQSWWFVVALVVLIVLGSAAATRALSSVRFLPSAISAAVLLGTMTLFFATETAILGVFPTFDTVARYGELFASANESVYRQSIPAQADPSIVFVLCVGIGAIAVLADAVAISLRAPALVGVLAVGILAIPAVTATDITDLFFFLLTAAAFLGLLVISSSRRQPALALAIGSSAVFATLLLPVVLPGLDERAITPSGPSSGVNPVLSLGDDLRRSSERTVLDYSTESGSPHYLRLVSLEQFTGDSWRPTEREIDTENSVDEFGPVPGLDADVAVAEETTRVDIRNLTTEWLPVPYPARSVTGLGEDWYWDAEGYSVSSPDDTPRGEEYEVQSLVLQPTPEQLLAAGTTVTAGLDDYLELPEDLPEVIAETAGTVVAGAPTNYEKAIALQEYFRSAEFTYSEDAPVDGDYDGTGMEVIAEFLEARSGYCVHFASSMAVMARALDIPARVIVGFLPGTPEPEDGVTVFEVTTHDLHAWPELYFDGIGWVQFEPTPGRGELGDYADVANADVPAPAAPAAPAAPTPGATAPSVAPSDRLNDPGALPEDGGQASTVQSDAAARVGLGALGLLLLSLVPAGIRLLQRRRLTARLRSRSASALDAWTETLRTAVDLRIPVPTTDTPRETAAALPLGGAPMSRLLAATEEKGYAATTLTDPRALVDDVDAVRRALGTHAGRRARLLAAFYPGSIWWRILHPLTPPTVGH